MMSRSLSMVLGIPVTEMFRPFDSRKETKTKASTRRAPTTSVLYQHAGLARDASCPLRNDARCTYLCRFQFKAPFAQRKHQPEDVRGADSNVSKPKGKQPFAPSLPPSFVASLTPSSKLGLFATSLTLCMHSEAMRKAPRCVPSPPMMYSWFTWPHSTIGGRFLDASHRHRTDESRQVGTRAGECCRPPGDDASATTENAHTYVHGSSHRRAYVIKARPVGDENARNNNTTDG